MAAALGVAVLLISRTLEKLYDEVDWGFLVFFVGLFRRSRPLAPCVRRSESGKHRAIHPLEGDEVAARVDHGDVHFPIAFFWPLPPRH
jgi:hypothetical protein